MTGADDATPYTVVIADDHQIVRDGLRAALSSPGVVESRGLRVVGEAANGFEAMAQVRRHRPHLLLLDVAMPLAGGAEVVVDIRRWSPATAIVVLTGIEAPGLVASLLELGVEGMFSKAAPLEEMYRRLPVILRGGKFIGDEFTRLLETHRLSDALTARERQTLNMIVAGKTSREIAAALSISLKTVDKHRSSLMRKLDVHSVVELMSLALKEGLIDPAGTSRDPPGPA